MSLISSSIPNFVNGISQQPFTLRLSSQGERQVNGLSTVSSGLRKRPPTQHLAKVSATPLASAFVHMIDRDDTEQYQVIATSGGLKVYDLAGVEKTVVITDAAYLNCGATPAGDAFAMTTVADYTFVVNKTKVVAYDPAIKAARSKEALVNVRLGNYGKTYTILINGASAATFTTPNGTVGTDVTQLSTDYIATQLYTALVAGGFNAGVWTSVRHGTVIHITNSGADFRITCEDGFSNNAMVAIKDDLQKFSDLPSNPRVDGFTVQIVGEQASDFDNYWVKFDAGGVNDDAGVWRETLQPGARLGLDATTMPHKLVRLADGTFTFGPATWDQRKVGDMTSSPDPSFVGRTINDLFFFQNRLGFLSDENYLQTETGKYFNVFRTTVTTLLDSDPVDVNAATNKVAILQHAVGFNKQLLLFSAQQQFLVDSSETMTPKKVPIKPTTDFAVSTRAKPVAAGRNVYFVTDKGNWSSVREFFAQQTDQINDASDVTAHVPKYIPSGVVKIAAGTTEDVLVLLSDEDRTRLFVYKYYFSGNEKLQSSWSEFTFGVGGTILNCEFIRSVLYLVISRADGIYFEKMDFAAGASAAGEPYQVALDRKVTIAAADLTFDGTHTHIDPAAIGYEPPIDGAFMTVAHGGGAIKAGQLRPVILEAGEGVQAKILGDYTASDLSFGQKYTFRYTLSVLCIKVKSLSGGVQSDTEGRTQVRRIAFNHAETGYYQVKVTPEARQTYTYVFAGKILGSSSAQIGSEVLPTGRFIAPVMSRNTTVDIAVESDMPLPVGILSADWEAMYDKRSTPV